MSWTSRTLAAVLAATVLFWGVALGLFFAALTRFVLPDLLL